MTRRVMATVSLCVLVALAAAGIVRQSWTRPDRMVMPAPSATVAASSPIPTVLKAQTRTIYGAGPVIRSIALVKPATVDAADVIAGAPTVSAAFVDAVLRRERSQLAGEGDYIVAQGRRWGIDPVFLLAFVTVLDAPSPLSPLAHNVGHIHAVGSAPAIAGFRAFASWRAGIDAWYALMHNLYLRTWSLRTLDAVLPVYAPGAGRRDVETALNRMRGLIAVWRSATA